VAALLLDRLRELDLDAIGMNVHHRADLLARILGPDLAMQHEPWLRGTAGALAGAAPFLRAGGNFLVASGDGVHDVDLGALIARHRESGAAATITAKRIARPETCALVELDDAGFVTRFAEKPPPAEVFTDLVSIGIYCFRPDVLDAIPGDRPFDIAGELIPALLARGDPVAAYETDAWWSDIGDPGELLAANLALAGGACVIDSDVAAGAAVEGPAMVGPHSTVGAGAVVRGSLVLPGAVVAPGAVIEDTIHGTGEDVLRAWLR
jgi:mannose-1-phosphate guanylyltransferase